MAPVAWIDRWERIRYLAGFKEPLPPGTSGCMFNAWRHPDGSLRHEPLRSPSS
jgi:hypothetical protein